MNLSAGRMFRVEDLKDRDAAATRVGAEPLVEIIQHKGDSECIGGVDETDEQCGFEKLPYDRFGGKYYKGLLFAPVAASFVRAAIGNGLAAPPLLALLLVLARDRSLVHEFRSGVVSLTIVGLALVVSVGLPLAYLVAR